MPLGYAGATDALSNALRRTTEIWATVGHTNIDDQPAKHPSEDELDALTESLEDAQKALKDYRAARKKAGLSVTTVENAQHLLTGDTATSTGYVGALSQLRLGLIRLGVMFTGAGSEQAESSYRSMTVEMGSGARGSDG